MTSSKNLGEALESHYSSKKNEFEDEFKHSLHTWTNGVISLWESNEKVNLEQILDDFAELGTHIGKSFVKRALRETFGDRKKAAELLNINMRKLRYLLNEKGHSRK